jgi:hypothetical protein
LLGGDADEGKTDIVETMPEIDDQLLLLLLLAHVSLEAVPEIVVVQTRHHDILEVVVWVAMVDLLERFDSCVGVDVYGDAVLVGKDAVPLDLEEDVVGSLVDLDEPVGTFVIPLHIFAIIKFTPVEILSVNLSLLPDHHILDVGVSLHWNFASLFLFGLS